VCTSMVSLKIRSCKAPPLPFFGAVFFGISMWILAHTVNFYKNPLAFWWELHWVCRWAWERMDNITILSLLVLKIVYLFIYLLPISFSNVLYFPVYRFAYLLSDLSIKKILILL
jgi:hypothetical protein